MRWRLSWRADPAAARLADQHYSRQNPGTAQFVPPGRCLVLVAGTPVNALWVTSWPLAEYTHHQWSGSWICSLFRNQGAGLSSELISEAVSVTRWYRSQEASWSRDPEPDQFITFVKPDAIRSRNPGYCYKCAGWRLVGHTQIHKLPALALSSGQYPEPRAPAGIGDQLSLW